ncbi:MAG: signal peptidase II [Bacteriovoracaceae bacterium]|nr:signal peptidase II [Bacteriovoracaceae bacterium]
MKKKENGRTLEDEGLELIRESGGGQGKRPRSFLMWGVFLVLPLYLADQFTKWLVYRNVEVGTGFTVIPGFFDIIHMRNTGAAFGILRDIPEPVRTYFFLGITLVALVAIFTIFSRLRQRSWFFKAILCLIVAGALGNLTDRFLFGEVVDFLSFYIDRFRWPTFNLADTYISLGMVGLLVTVVFMPKEQE